MVGPWVPDTNAESDQKWEQGFSHQILKTLAEITKWNTKYAFNDEDWLIDRVTKLCSWRLSISIVLYSKSNPFNRTLGLRSIEIVSGKFSSTISYYSSVESIFFFFNLFQWKPNFYSDQQMDPRKKRKIHRKKKLNKRIMFFCLLEFHKMIFIFFLPSSWDGARNTMHK